MSAVSVGSARVPLKTNSFIPEVLRPEQNIFGSASIYHRDRHISESSTLERLSVTSKTYLDSCQSNCKEKQPYPICNYCQRPIAESYLYRIRGQTWHEGCATCSVCSGELTDVCFLLDGRLFCPRDYDRLHAVRCVNCRQPMRSHELFMRAEYPKSHPPTADSKQLSHLVFHVSCFTCCVCQQPLAAGDPYTIDPQSNRPICRTDYLSSRDASESSVNPSISPPHPIHTKRSSKRRVSRDHIPTNGTVSSPMGHFNRLSDTTNLSDQYTGQSIVNSVTYPGNKRVRTSLTDEQRMQLQQAFERSSRPSKAIRESLAHELGVPLRVVQVWFQNQRARDKRASHSNQSWIPSQTIWSKSQPPAKPPPSPTPLTPSPRTSVESCSNPDFGGLTADEMHLPGSIPSSSSKQDAQPWRPAFSVSGDT